MKYLKNLHLVTSVTPHRISFAGGATDLPKFYKKNGGRFISATINKFIYVTVKKHDVFNKKFRIMYSKTENKNTINSIENDIVRCCLKFLKLDIPLLIFTSSDIPTNSGLGSSSAFTVGLLHALYTLQGRKISRRKLAQDACYVEIEMMKKNCGIQDQYAAAFGGINDYKINKNGNVKIKKLSSKNFFINKLFENIILVETKTYRSSDNISKTYRIDNNILKLLKKSTFEFKNIITKKKINLNELGNFLHSNWIEKKKLSNKISNKKLDKIYNDFVSKGALGGKLLGAGGGGYFMFIMSKNKQKNISSYYKSHKIIKFRYQSEGSRILNKLYVPK